MKKVCKVVCRILGVFMGFILINLLIGVIVYGGTKNYSDVLNQKDWQQSLSEISLLKPKTRVAMFYSGNVNGNGTGNLSSDSADMEGISEIDKILGELLLGDQEEDINHNPYDPDYEDEFNSFFGASSEETGAVIPVQKIENLEQAGFIIDENTGD